MVATLITTGIGGRVRIVAHSNGANIVLDALRDKGWPPVEHIHLISPACERDLSYLAPRLGNEIGRLTIWMGGKDMPLRLGDAFGGSSKKWVRNLWPGRWLGYGGLGYHGPEGFTAAHFDSGLVQIVEEPGFGHSTWFKNGQFDRTMQRIVE